MPSIVWILMWAVLIGLVTWAAVREVRAKRALTADFEKQQYLTDRAVMQVEHPNGENRWTTGLGG